MYVAKILVNMTKESAKSRNTAMVKPCPLGERGGDAGIVGGGIGGRGRRGRRGIR